jgi:hypothetical protein
MDSHVTGPRGRNAYGAIVTAIGFGAARGDAAQTGKEITRTQGASVKNPLLVEIFGHIRTAFDGTAPAFSLVETNLDGSGAATLANIAGFAGGKFALSFVLTVDKIYKVVYTPPGDGTVGEGFYFLKVTGPGQLPVG